MPGKFRLLSGGPPVKLFLQTGVVLFQQIGAVAGLDKVFGEIPVQILQILHFLRTVC